MDIFKVSNSGGMRRSHETNSLVLVSDYTRGVYDDRWEGDILHYTGMGREGDQSLEFMQNKTLNESDSLDINIFLFEVFKRGEYTYKGRVELADEPYQEKQKDINGDMRSVWIFPTKIINSNKNVPKIVVMNINPKNIDSCIQYTIHGTKVGTGAVSDTEKLERGDICIIRKTSGEDRYKYGVVGIWYYYDKEDIEGDIKDLWTPRDGWKYKIHMKPLVREFQELFEEDFSKDFPGQNKHKESTKVDGLIYTDIQGALRINFNDPELPKKYLKAIIEEKREECYKEADWEDSNGNKYLVNVYEFLNSIMTENLISTKNTGEKNHHEKPKKKIKSREKKDIQKIDFKKLASEFIKYIEKVGLKFKREAIYRIFTALKSNKNLIITGPPGSGKTTLAEELSKFLKQQDLIAGYKMTTATSDWSTFETIGGYKLQSSQELEFQEGIFLEAIKNNKWLIVDEINRADIDKALGEFHTVISGQSVILPFEKESKRIRIIPSQKELEAQEKPEDTYNYYISSFWKIIGTMNSYDKSFLFNLSFALMRRFSFIDIAIPDKDDYDELIDNKIQKLTNLDRDLSGVFKDIIKNTINRISRQEKVREIAPAIIIDIIEYVGNRYSITDVKKEKETTDEEREDKYTLLKEFIIEGYILNLLPQFEGLRENELDNLIYIFEEIFESKTVMWELRKRINELKFI